MIKKILAFIFTFHLGYSAQAQTKQLRDVYLSLPIPSNTYSNPLEIGVSLKTGKQFDAFFGYNLYSDGYSTKGYYSSALNFYIPDETLRLGMKDGDSISYEIRNISNRGHGLRIGISREFEIAKLHFITRTSINPMLNLHDLGVITGTAYYSDSVYYEVDNTKRPGFKEQTISASTQHKKSFSPQVSTEFGMVFLMGKSLKLTPKVVCTLSGRNAMLFAGYYDKTSYEISLNMQAAMHLSYTINHFY